MDFLWGWEKPPKSQQKNIFDRNKTGLLDFKDISEWFGFGWNYLLAGVEMQTC